MVSNFDHRTERTSHMLSWRSAVLFVTTLLTSSSVLRADEPTAPSPGATVNDVTLRDIHRRPVSLSDFADKRAVVVAFIGTECPIANLAVPRLIALHEKYAEQGVQFLAINSNVQDEFIEVSAHAQEREIPFPVLKDFDHSTADAFGATRTPEYFVLDADRVIQYHGRLDDQYTIGFTHRVMI